MAWKRPRLLMMVEVKSTIFCCVVLELLNIFVETTCQVFILMHSQFLSGSIRLWSFEMGSIVFLHSRFVAHFHNSWQVIPILTYLDWSRGVHLKRDDYIVAVKLRQVAAVKANYISVLSQWHNSIYEMITPFITNYNHNCRSFKPSRLGSDCRIWS